MIHQNSNLNQKVIAFAMLSAWICPGVPLMRITLLVLILMYPQDHIYCGKLIEKVTAI